MLKTGQLLGSSLVILITAVAQSIQFLRLALSSRTALSAEVLFLRKQLAFYQEHQIRPRKLTAAARFSLVLWSRFFNWRQALMIVKPDTLIGWHRKGFKLWWRWKSRLGRPRISEDLRHLIVSHGAGESDLGRGACSGGAVGEARDTGIAPDSAGLGREMLIRGAG